MRPVELLVSIFYTNPVELRVHSAQRPHNNVLMFLLERFNLKPVGTSPSSSPSPSNQNQRTGRDGHQFSCQTPGCGLSKNF